MTIKVTQTHPSQTVDWIIPVFNGDRRAENLREIATFFKYPFDILERDFKGEANECIFFYGKDHEKIFLLGVGKNPGFGDLFKIFKAFSVKHKKLLSKEVLISLLFGNAPREERDCLSWIDAAVNGVCLGTYNIHLYQTEHTNQHHPLSVRDAGIFIATDCNMTLAEQAAQKGHLSAETQARIMDLVNAPNNKKAPRELGQWAKNSAQEHAYSVEVISKEEAEELGLHALMAVNRGSEYPAVFILLKYNGNGSDTPQLGLVGKGVTFDTGGVSLKGTTNMHYMKSDMGGAAAVLGTFELVAKLKLPIHMVGAVPVTDNSIGTKAVKPGDVIGSYSGKTIEVIDTDAEGRLILADGLAYIKKKYNPYILINLATLTGSVVRTLGYSASGLFSNNDQLAQQLFEAGQNTGERVWRLPIWEEYLEDMKSDIADIRNLSSKPVAGAITAAKFLEFFIDHHPNWAHLDIAGVAFGQNDLSKQKSATGYGIRLLTAFAEMLSTASS